MSSVVASRPGEKKEHVEVIEQSNIPRDQWMEFSTVEELIRYQESAGYITKAEADASIAAL